jgi:hypothetical protein
MIISQNSHRVAKKTINLASSGPGRSFSFGGELNNDMTVYQVQAIDVRGNIRIVHAYETKQLATEAVTTMKAFSRIRYAIVPVENDPTQYWGINT